MNFADVLLDPRIHRVAVPLGQPKQPITAAVAVLAVGEIEQLSRWAGGVEPEEAGLRQTRRSGQPEIRPERRRHAVQKEDRVLRRVMPVAWPLYPAAIRTILAKPGANRIGAQPEKPGRPCVAFPDRQCRQHQPAVTDKIPVHRRSRPIRRRWRGELLEPSLYGFVDYRPHDPLTLLGSQDCVQPVVTDRGPESGLGSNQEFVARPIRKITNSNQLLFGAIAVSRVISEQPGDSERLHPQTKQTRNVERSSRTIQ